MKSIIDTFNYLKLPKVHFWVRTPVPENHDDTITFIQRMVSVGVNPETTERHMKQIMKRGTCYKLNEGTLPVDQIQCI